MIYIRTEHYFLQKQKQKKICFGQTTEIRVVHTFSSNILIKKVNFSSWFRGYCNISTPATPAEVGVARGVANGQFL